MNADKFMIGDWFSFRIDGKTYTEKVLGITLSGLLVKDPYGDSEDETCDAWSDDASEEDDGYIPIPLTPEILEKNEFKYDEEATETIKDFFSYPVMLFSFPLGIGFNIEWDTENNVGMITDHCWIKFKYVHELQHALRLCGIKKEIEL